MGSLSSEIKVRVSDEMKASLQRVAEEMGEGQKISDAAREAIGEYLKNRKPKKPVKYAGPKRKGRRAGKATAPSDPPAQQA